MSIRKKMQKIRDICRKISVFLLILCVLADAFPSKAAASTANADLSQSSASNDEEETLDTCCIADITVAGSTASILYYADVDADTSLSIVLTVYQDDGYGDMGDFISTAQGDIQPSAEDATCNLSIDLKGNQYFVLQAYITDGSLNSSVYTTNLYSETVQKILKSSLEDYDQDRTVPIAGSGNTASFVVLKEGSHILKCSDGYTLQAENDGINYRLYGTENSPAALDISAGDAICFVDDSGPRMYRGDLFDGLDEAGDPIETEQYYDYTFLAVQAVSEQDGALIITSDPDQMATDGSDLFETVCLRSVGDSNISWKGTKHFEKKLDKTVADAFKLSGSLVLDVEYALVLSIHVTKKSTAYAKLLGTYLLKDFALDVYSKFTWESPTLGINLTTGVASFAFGFMIDVEVSQGATGEIDLNADGRIGFQINNFKPSSLCKKPTFKVSEFSLNGDATVTLAVGPSADFMKYVISAGMSWNLGIKFKTTTGGNEGGDGEDSWHACESEKCLSIKAELTMFPYFYASILGKKLTYSPVRWSYPTAEGYYSQTFKDHAWDFNFREWSLKACPHYGYRVTVTAQDSAGNPLEGVKLSMTPQYPHYEAYSEGTTAANGKANLYISNGIDYTLTGIYEEPNSNVQRTGSISGIVVFGEPQAITLTLDAVHTLHFDQNFSGDVTNIPGDLTACKDASVTIPAIIPEASGQQFAGWALSADATVPQYYPGSSFVMPDENVTLYAVWTIPNNDWFVIYDANGGEDAPATVKAASGGTIRISGAEPRRKGYTFRGWAKSKDAEEPYSGYQAGSVLSKPENTTYVILHAVWLENPVITCHVVYNANGGKGAPEDQWVTQGTSFNLSSTIPTRTAHVFAGWKYNGTVYQPGDAMTLTGDAWLVAVWNPDYRITEGAGSVWIRGSGDTLRFVCNGEYELFKALVVDGSVVDASGYTAQSGSTIVTLQDCLDSLEDGEHQILFRYEDGDSSEASFTIATYTPPHTGDSTHPAIWAAILGLCAASLFLLIGRRKKHSASR